VAREVEYDFCGSLRHQLQKYLHEPGFQVAMPGHNLLVAAGRTSADRRQLQPIERALAGQGLAPVTRIDTLLAQRVPLADQRGQ
jgi:hypothetical protein